MSNLHLSDGASVAPEHESRLIENDPAPFPTSIRSARVVVVEVPSFEMVNLCVELSG
jgi:hypothetical protein